MDECWIIDGVRTPRATLKKFTLSHLHPQRLLAGSLNALKDRVGLDEKDVDDVIIGCAEPEGVHKSDIARLSVLDAGWNVQVPGITVSRFCGSGMSAMSFASYGIKCGQFECVVAGGVEMMSRYIPPTIDRPFTLDGGNLHLRSLHPIIPQGLSGDLIATLEGFSREDCDRLALESQKRTATAIAEGRFDKSMVPVKNDDGSIALDHEEHPRPGTTIEALGGLNAAFAEMTEVVWPDLGMSFLQCIQKVYPQVKKLNNVHTAGNSSGIVDAASVLLMCSPEYAKAHGLKPRARVVTGTSVAVEPIIMLTAPGPAALKCLNHVGMKVSDVDLWEINEAFAAVTLKAIRDLGLDLEIVNVNGGAMSLGHPVGATAGILTLTALDELERQNKQTAMITLCTGGGMGSAMLIERI